MGSIISGCSPKVGASGEHAPATLASPTGTAAAAACTWPEEFDSRGSEERKPQTRAADPDARAGAEKARGGWPWTSELGMAAGLDLTQTDRKLNVYASVQPQPRGSLSSLEGFLHPPSTSEIPELHLQSPSASDVEAGPEAAAGVDVDVDDVNREGPDHDRDGHMCTFLDAYALGTFGPDEPPARPPCFAAPYLVAPKGPDEAGRLRRLRRLQLLEREGNDEEGAPFERLSKLAAALLRVPVALVSIVDAEEQRFAGHGGAKLPRRGRSTRDLSFCAHAILRKEADPMVVEDAQADWRFRGHPMVAGPPHIRFYAGAPLVTSDGHRLGTLCCMDFAPRRMSSEERAHLAELAATVVHAAEHHATKRATHRQSRLSEAAARFALEAMTLPDEDAVYELAAESAHAALGLGARGGVTLAAAAPPLGEGGGECGGAWPVRTMLVGTERRDPAGRVVERAPGCAAAALGCGGSALWAGGEGGAAPVPAVAAEAGAVSGVLAAAGRTGGCVGCFSAREDEELPDEALEFVRLLASAATVVVEQQRARAALQAREAALRWRTRLTERLLRAILPEAIIPRLLARPGPVASYIPSATILFADIVGFTRLAGEVEAPELVEMLGLLFGVFDRLCAHFRVEKIKTIGDAFMAASGVPEPREDHAAAAVELAWSMAAALDHFNAVGLCGRLPPIRIRIGLHSGPVVGGVIGESKLQYDLWGDTVNIASRMESHGVAGRIQVSGATRALAGDGFEWEARPEPVAIKGKDEPVQTFLLAGRRSGAGVGGPPPALDVVPFFDTGRYRPGSIVEMCRVPLDGEGRPLGMRYSASSSSFLPLERPAPPPAGH